MRCAGDVELDVEPRRALESRRETNEPHAAPFVYRPGMPADPRTLTLLQRSAGNAAVGTLLRSHPPRPRSITVQRRAATHHQPAPPAPAAEHGTENGKGHDVGGGGPVEESVMTGGSGGNVKEAPVKGGDDGRAAQASVQAIAKGERAAIVADAMVNNARLDQQLAAAQGKLGAQIGTAKSVAVMALAGATNSTQAFFAAKHAEVMGAANQAEQAATTQATAMATAAQAQVSMTGAQMNAATASIAGGLRGRVAGFADQIVGAITGISLPDLPGVGAIRSGITNLVRKAAGGVTAGINAVQQMIARALATGMAAVRNVIGKATNIVMDVVRKIASGIRAAATRAAQTLMTIAAKVASALSGFLHSKVFPALDRLRAEATKHLTAGTKQAKGAVKANTDYHLAALDKVAKTAVPAGGQQAGGGAGAGDDPVATFRAIGTRSRENNQILVNTFTGRFSAVVASVAAMALSGAGQVAQRVTGLATQVISTVAGKVGEALQAVRQIGAAVSGFLQTILGAVRSALSSAIEWVQRAATNPAEELVAFGSKALAAAKSFITNAVNNVLRGNFSLPSLGLGAFQAKTDTAGQVPTEAVTASFGTSASGVLSILGIILAALAGIVLLPFILGGIIALALVALAALVIFGPLLAAAALIIYGIVKLVQWIATPAKLEVTHDTDLKAPDGSPKTRTTVGVGERVMLKASKLSVWKATAGDPTSTAPKAQVRWRAPFKAGSAEITAEVVDKSMSSKVAFDVVEPSSLTAKKESEKSYPTGEQGVGMVLNFLYGPTNVSFGGGEARERSGGASAIKGYYEHEGMPHFHTASPGFFTIAENNQLAGPMRDTAAQFGQPKPWEHGSFHWAIDNEFRADDSVAPKIFTTVKQEFVMADETGTTTITKGGASVTRKP